MPCDRLFYYPSLSYAHLSTFNVEDLVIGSETRRQHIESNFQTAVEVSNAVVKELVNAENILFQRLSNSLDAIHVSFQDHIRHFETTEKMAKLLDTTDVITDMRSALYDYYETAASLTSAEEVIYELQKTDIKVTNNQLLVTILDSLNNPLLSNPSDVFEGCIETSTKSATTMLSDTGARKRREISVHDFMPVYEGEQDNRHGLQSNLNDPLYRNKRDAYTLDCSRVLYNIFPYHYSYKEYMQSILDENNESIVVSLIDQYEIVYEDTLIELFNFTHVYPEDFPEHDICLSSLEYLQNVTDPAITTIVKAVSDLFSLSHDRNEVIELLGTIKEAIDMGELEDTENIFSKSASCLWTSNYIASSQNLYAGSKQANPVESDILQDIETIISSSLQKSSTVTIDFDMVQRSLNTFMESFTEHFLPNKRYILEYKRHNLFKDLVARYVTNSQSQKIGEEFFTTLSQFEIKLKSFHENLETIRSLCIDLFQTFFSLSLPIINDKEMYNTRFWKEFVYNTSDIYLSDLEENYVFDRRRYINEIFDRIYEPHLTYLSAVISNTSAQREAMFNIINDLDNDMNDFLQSKKMAYDFYM